MVGLQLNHSLFQHFDDREVLVHHEMARSGWRCLQDPLARVLPQRRPVLVDEVLRRRLILDHVPELLEPVGHRVWPDAR